MGERVRTRKTSTRNLDLTYDTRTSHRSTAGQGGNCILTESEILHGSYRPGEIMKVSQNSLLGSQIIYISSPPAEENVSWTWKINSERKKGRARWIMERWKTYCPQEQDVDSTLNVPFVYCFSYFIPWFSGVYGVHGMRILSCTRSGFFSSLITTHFIT